MPFDIGDKHSVLFTGLSGFWQRFFKDAQDIEAYYQASEIYLGQVYLDLLSAVLNIGVQGTSVFNREYWKLFPILETEVNFMGGFSSAFGQYVYDMPGDSVNVDFLQNAILEPTIVLERDASFSVLEDDGYIRFMEDPFNAVQDEDGNWMPTPGTAWRTVRRSVGNAAYDLGLKLYNESTHNTGSAYDVGARRGDTLRVLAYKGSEIATGLTGSILNNPSQSVFNATGVGNCRVGDVIHVHGHAGTSPGSNDTWKGFYVVKTILTADKVELEPSTVPTTLWSSTANLYWKLNRSIYFEVTETTPFRDYEQDYYEGMRSIGSPDNPFPLDLAGPVVTAVVRDDPNPDVYGVALTYLTATTGTPTTPFVVGALGTITQVAHKHLIPGTVKIQAYKYVESGSPSDEKLSLVEDVDYSIDYHRGIIHQLAYWDDTSLGRCDYHHRTEVSLSGATHFEEYAVGNVRQLSYWVPEVNVDQFNLWYNYGSLLNRFDASSDAYKAFLAGVMYLYMTGPVLQRIESALNVAAEYPVVLQDGEVLQSYDDGVNGSGVSASIDGATDHITIPTAEYILGDVDVGGYIILAEAMNDSNEGKFRILSIDTATNTLLAQTTYGLVTETPVAWVISHTYTKSVVTDLRTYEYPYSTPIRADIIDRVNWNTLRFIAFEPLTTAFTVTDYIEDPDWWNNSTIPPLLWDAPTARRRSSSALYEHVIGASDGACIDDPGLYIGADENGVVIEVEEAGELLPILRHNVAYVLFDRYLKMHMYSIQFAVGLELDAQFREDLEEIVLIAKPAYTYPAVDANNLTIDNVGLMETDLEFLVTLLMGGDTDNGLSSLHNVDNTLKIGDEDFPWHISNFYKYAEQALTPTVTDPIPVGTTILPSLPAGCSLLGLSVDATRTADTEPAIEGRDYTVNWLAEDPVGTPNASRWQIEFLTECTAGGVTLGLTCHIAERLLGTYNTTEGWTPLCIGGLNPWYIRNGALDPTSITYAEEFAALRTEYIDRPVQLTVVPDTAAPTTTYTYP